MHIVKEAEINIFSTQTHLIKLLPSDVLTTVWYTGSFDNLQTFV